MQGIITEIAFADFSGYSDSATVIVHRQIIELKSKIKLVNYYEIIREKNYVIKVNLTITLINEFRVLNNAMTIIKVKGHEFNAVLTKDSFNRRALQYRNSIIQTLKKIGLTEDDIKIEMETMAMKKAAASVSFYVENQHLYFSYGRANKFVDNLYVVLKVMELEVKALLDGEKPIESFISDFSEHHDIKQKRIEARETLGLPHETNDLEIINKAYKNLAKEHHPDVAGGDTENFKKINHAHKMLKRELE